MGRSTLSNKFLSIQLSPLDTKQIRTVISCQFLFPSILLQHMASKTKHYPVLCFSLFDYQQHDLPAVSFPPSPQGYFPSYFLFLKTSQSDPPGISSYYPETQKGKKSKPLYIFLLCPKSNSSFSVKTGSCQQEKAQELMSPWTDLTNHNKPVGSQVSSN